MVAQSASLCNNLQVAGTANVQGNITASNAALGGSLVVAQSASLCNNLQVAGTANVLGNLSTACNFAASNASLGGSLFVGQALEVSGNSTIDSDLTVQGTVWTSSIGSTSSSMNIGTGSNIAFINLGTGTNPEGLPTVINIGSIGGTVNIPGTLTVNDQTNTAILDKVIILNRHGGAGTGGSSGFEIEEDAGITGYIKTSDDRTSFLLRTPASTSDLVIDISGCNANFNNDTLVLTSSGNVAMGTDTPTTGYRLFVSGNLYADNIHGGSMLVDGSAQVSGGLAVQQAASFCNDVNVAGNLSGSNAQLQGGLAVQQAASFCNDVNVAGNLSGSNAQLQGGLAVQQAATFCNDVNVGGTATFSSNMVVNGSITASSFNTPYSSNTAFNNGLDIYGQVLAHCNLSFISGASVSNAGDLTVSGLGTIDVQQQMLVKDLVIYGSITLCNGATSSGNISGGGGGIPGSGNLTTSSNYIVWSNIVGDPITEYMGTVVIDDNLYVGGTIFSGTVISSTVAAQDLLVTGSTTFCNDVNVCGRLNVQSNATITGDLALAGCTIKFDTSNSSSNVTTWWDQSVTVNPDGLSADMVFSSVNGTKVVFTDEFQAETLNFTGKHRATFLPPDPMCDPSTLLGQVVIATGKYMNLDGTDDIAMDEAIPVVCLSSLSKDRRAFGVIGGFEQEGKFRLGNIIFETNMTETRAIIQSVGEGCVWVISCNGDIHNGDLLVTSDIPGFAMRQDDDIVRNYSIAKSTCDCVFSESVTSTLQTKTVWHRGICYTAALLGVVYRF